MLIHLTEVSTLFAASILYMAYDIILYLQNPSTSLPETIRLINTFSELSDYTINWSKSTLPPLI